MLCDLLFIFTFSCCRREQNRCLERLSRVCGHEARSKETCGMCCAHILDGLESLVVQDTCYRSDPRKPGAFIVIPGFSWWDGGLCCSPGDPNTPGHCIKLLGGKGSSGTDAFTRGQKMMECGVLSRFCHLPVSSYLQGSSDVELRSVRYLFTL